MGQRIGKIIPANTPEQNRFTSISDFKWSMKCGGEVVFRWEGMEYCCFSKLEHPESGKIMMYISKTDREDGGRTSEKWCETSDDVLEYMVGFDRLRDVITKVTVIERTI